MKVNTDLGCFYIEYAENLVIYKASLDREEEPLGEERVWGKLKDKLIDYSKGKKVIFDEKIYLNNKPEFTTKVLSYLNEKVGFGEVITYQGLAIAAGSEKAARAVGQIMKNNHLFLFVP
jgi:O6-methylguanine-DNA--protein-cysteine methyltransferase